MPLRPLRAASLAAAVALLTSCGTDEPAGTAATAPDDGHYPLTTTSCGEEVTIEAEPTDVVLLKSAWVPYLDTLGVLDHVTAKAGAYPQGYYDDETNTAVEGIDSLTDRMDSSGHLLISKEAVVAREPDLVLGQVENLDRASLAELGIPLLEVGGLCPTGGPDPSFEAIGTELEELGRVFHREDEAAKAARDLEERVETITASVPSDEDRTAAVLYPTVGGGTTYAYGSRSMADPQLEAAGLTNVYADVDERVFEVTTESLLEEDPDVVVLLYSDGDPAKVEDALTALPGAERLTAVRDDAVVTQLFNFTEPASPLAVDGLERIVEELATGDAR